MNGALAGASIFKIYIKHFSVYTGDLQCLTEKKLFQNITFLTVICKIIFLEGWGYQVYSPGSNCSPNYFDRIIYDLSKVEKQAIYDALVEAVYLTLSSYYYEASL